MELDIIDKFLVCNDTNNSWCNDPCNGCVSQQNAVVLVHIELENIVFTDCTITLHTSTVTRFKLGKSIAMMCLANVQIMDH